MSVDEDTADMLCHIFLQVGFFAVCDMVCLVVDGYTPVSDFIEIFGELILIESVITLAYGFTLVTAVYFSVNMAEVQAQPVQYSVFSC